MVNSGNACHKHAINPHKLGFENEVPLPVIGVPVVRFAATAGPPTDTTLGFNKPAPLGPQLLKEEIFPFTSVEPMVKTLSDTQGA